MSNDPRIPVLNVIETLADQYLKGKVKAVKLAMISLLSGGHLLLEDIPGLGKTTLALALSHALGLSFGRIQCTSDLLPSDITGLSVYDRNNTQFNFIQGPVFNNLLEEHRVTVEGKTYRLPDPFMVIATQNPVEQFGTYPLPESQLDRFLITTGIGYPPEAMEKTIIQTGSIREGIREIEPLLTLDELLRAREAINKDVQLSDKITEYIYQLVATTREHPMLMAGVSTRGGISLAAASRSHAFLAGRDHVIPEDVKALFVSVCAHRLIMRPENETIDRKELLQSLLDEIPVPLA
jgi:MoxR-like ATPase